MKHRPALAPDFVPAVLWNRSYAAKVEKNPGSKPLVISLERGDSTVSVYRTTVLPHTSENSALNIRYVERLLKFLLWQRGGYTDCAQLRGAGVSESNACVCVLVGSLLLRMC